MSNQNYYKKAKKVVASRKEFRQAMVVFTLTLPFLVLINLLTYPGYLWFLWVVAGMVISAGFLYYQAYIEPKQVMKDREKIADEMRNLRRQEEDFLDLESRPNKGDFDRRFDLREVRRDYDTRDLV